MGEGERECVLCCWHQVEVGVFSVFLFSPCPPPSVKLGPGGGAHSCRAVVPQPVMGSCGRGSNLFSFSFLGRGDFVGFSECVLPGICYVSSRYIYL